MSTALHKNRSGSLLDGLDSVLLPTASMDRLLRELLSSKDVWAEGAQLQFLREGGERPRCDFTVGVRGEGEPTHAVTEDLQDQWGTKCKVRVWTKAGTGGTDEVTNLFAEIAHRFWRSTMRDEKTNLPAPGDRDAVLTIEGTVEYLAKAGAYLAVGFWDLDGFKEVNDTYGHNEGDRVIGELAWLLQRTVGDMGVVVHLSGDEFATLLPVSTASVMIDLGRRLMDAVKDHDFGLSDLGPRISGGVVVGTHSEFIRPDWRELINLAEQALNPPGGEKQRGLMRMVRREQVSPVCPLDSEDRQLVAGAMMRARLLQAAPFSSAWLNYLSRMASDGEIEQDSVATTINESLSWVGVDLSSFHCAASLRTEPNEGELLDPVFSPFDVLVAVAHGLLRTQVLRGQEGRPLKIHRNGGGDLLELVELEGGRILAGLPAQAAAGVGDVELGCAPTLPLKAFSGNTFEDALAKNTYDPRNSVLVRIGHSQPDLPEELFYRVIVVDDRPTRGGGLPDFWEATIAQLIATVKSNANLVRVAVFGNRAHAVRSCEKLEGVAEWVRQSDLLARKCGVSRLDVEAAAQRLKGRVTFHDSTATLLREVANTINQLTTIASVGDASPDNGSKRFLERELNLENMKLGRHDGCRVKTAAEAFPVILEIARSSDQESGELVDQAGRRLRELVDFKVHLETPLLDLVPYFYNEEAASLEAYYCSVLERKDGLFRRHLEEGGQMAQVVEHLITSIQGPKPFATRRAILVVPHAVRRGAELTPLGLISVRVVPRFEGTRVTLGFSFTWRTVEALVGFPYSLYASIRFSNHLLELVRVRSGNPSTLRCGELSYVAHSLHIFTDEYGQNIARRIVDDASK